MNADTAIELCRSAAMLSLVLSGPVLVAALAIGVIMGLLQGLTQVQDSSITFVPRLIALTLVMLLLLPWGLSLLTEFATDLIRGIPGTI